MDLAFAFPSVLLEDHPPAIAPKAPPICPVRARLMLDWYTAVPGFEQDLDLAILREHERLCLRCLRRNDWIRSYAPPAAAHESTPEKEGA